jgi:hypothetical protein
MFHNYFITRVRMINDECQDVYEEIRIKVPGKAYCCSTTTRVPIYIYIYTYTS